MRVKKMQLGKIAGFIYRWGNGGEYKMSMGLEEFKRKYNEALAREKKTERFFDDPALPMEKKELCLPEFHGIVRELSGMMMEFRLTSGREMSEREALEGFEVEG